MRSIDDKPIFANSVAGFGLHNGNINIALAAFLFSPDADGKKIDPDPVIVARLRMDQACGRQLMTNLQSIFHSIDDAVVTAAKANGAEPEAPAEAEKALN